ncbi:yippee family protein [Verticillium alfalfae VaMs.102]|uniref:Yippee family protein n=1 Tax=Verticillium alfalfae (strain VaMs.102 / ATCC MYA-4576 / FGSC 10136) TaxID=526221 RepID=C9S5T0_VERA1|nr:yippee family protein [Verticillium alfalfae VaMs.102]EEY14306.1 yippee family protein [Verticillium alfalfae VaMs.102]
MAPSSSKSPDLKPLFPSYLLPAFKLPFIRRPRQPSTSNTSDIPSLSSSPTSSAPSSAAGSPPSSLPERFGPSNPIIGSTAASSTARRLSRTNPDTLRCSTCASDIAFAAQIVSKGFTGRYGRAYLVAPLSPTAPSPSCSAPPAATPVRDLLNVRVGRSENRQLVTGWHVVADITCAVCHAKLGWKYVDAREEAQKYKVGKFILETERVVGFKRWEDVHDDADAVVGGGVLEGPASRPRSTRADDDNDDDDEQKKGVTPDDVVFDSDDEDECEDIFAGTWDPVVVAKRRGRKASAGK